MKCPKCGTKCEAEHVDIGVGNQRVEPWGCPACHWVEPTVEDEFDMEDDIIPGECMRPGDCAYPGCDCEV